MLLKYFRTQEYSKFYTILFFSSDRELKALINNTNIKKLQRIKIFSEVDIDSFRKLLNQRKNLLLTSFQPIRKGWFFLDFYNFVR